MRQPIDIRFTIDVRPILLHEVVAGVGARLRSMGLSEEWVARWEGQAYGLAFRRAEQEAGDPLHEEPSATFEG